MKSRNIKESFGFAFTGLFYAIRTQRNMRIHCLAGILSIVVFLFLGINFELLPVLVLTIVFVISVEMINTAIETTVDLFIEDYHRLAEIAKDVSAGAVLMASVGAFFIGLFIFLPSIIKLLR